VLSQGERRWEKPGGTEEVRKIQEQRIGGVLFLGLQEDLAGENPIKGHPNVKGKNKTERNILGKRGGPITRKNLLDEGIKNLQKGVGVYQK